VGAASPGGLQGIGGGVYRRTGGDMVVRTCVNSQAVRCLAAAVCERQEGALSLSFWC
jgi:hypothetical protein